MYSVQTHYTWAMCIFRSSAAPRSYSASKCCKELNQNTTRSSRDFQVQTVPSQGTILIVDHGWEFLFEQAKDGRKGSVRGVPTASREERHLDSGKGFPEHGEHL